MVDVARAETDLELYDFFGPPEGFRLPLDAVNIAEAETLATIALGGAALYAPNAFHVVVNKLQLGLEAREPRPTERLDATGMDIVYRGTVLAIKDLRTTRVAQNLGGASPVREREADFRVLFSVLHAARYGRAQPLPEL